MEPTSQVSGRGREDLGDQAGQDAADQRSHDRHPRVVPVCAALALDRQYRGRDARTEVTGRVDGIPRRAAERVTGLRVEGGAEGGAAAAIRGPRARAGLMASPVGPPSEFPMLMTTNATAAMPSAMFIVISIGN